MLDCDNEDANSTLKQIVCGGRLATVKHSTQLENFSTLFTYACQSPIHPGMLQLSNNRRVPARDQTAEKDTLYSNTYLKLIYFKT